ncbi:MAG TPA: hypothetical protein VFK05_08620 [Polyangiaceae bacterium]|nr:hypothetical protein [Polyangiaceae bacterium]
MTDFDALPLHDAVLYRVSLEWERRVASAEVAIFLDCSKPAVPAVLSWNGVRSVHLPCAEPWGPSVFIKKQYKTGPRSYAIEVQSGDVLEIDADGFSLARRDAVEPSTPPARS